MWKFEADAPTYEDILFPLGLRGGQNNAVSILSVFTSKSKYPSIIHPLPLNPDQGAVGAGAYPTLQITLQKVMLCN